MEVLSPPPAVHQVRAKDDPRVPPHPYPPSMPFVPSTQRIGRPSVIIHPEKRTAFDDLSFASSFLIKVTYKQLQ